MYGLETIAKMNQLATKTKGKLQRRAWNKQNAPEKHQHEPAALVPDKPPRGYRWLRGGSVLRKGDKYFSLVSCKWKLTSAPGETSIPGHYIRPI